MAAITNIITRKLSSKDAQLDIFQGDRVEQILLENRGNVTAYIYGVLPIFPDTWRYMVANTGTEFTTIPVSWARSPEKEGEKFRSDLICLLYQTLDDNE